MEPFEDIHVHLKQLLCLADKLIIRDLVTLELLNLDAHLVLIFLLQDIFKLILSLVVDWMDVILSFFEDLRE